MAATLLVILLGAELPSGAPGGINPYKACPINGQPFQPGWKYCPWHGTRIGTELAPRAIADRDPVQTVLAFFEAYRRADRQGMEEVLDMETILGEWIGASLDRWEGLSPNLRALMRKQDVPKEMAQALSPIVLDILTSNEMRETFPPEVVRLEDLLKLYYVQQADDLAWLNPSRLVVNEGFAAQRFHLRKKDGHWVITRMPFFPE
jgi:hypothetical protein